MKFVKSLLLLTLILTMVSGIAYPDSNKGKGKSLPPGLEKRAEQGKALPPGWQKKLHKGDILDNDIYIRGSVVVPVGSDGTLSIEVEGTLIKLHEKTREIIDILL